MPGVVRRRRPICRSISCNPLPPTSTCTAGMDSNRSTKARPCGDTRARKTVSTNSNAGSSAVQGSQLNPSRSTRLAPKRAVASPSRNMTATRKGPNIRKNCTRRVGL